MLSPPGDAQSRPKQDFLKTPNPGFPAKFGGVDALHAAFLDESRTRGGLGRISCHAAQDKTACAPFSLRKGASGPPTPPSSTGNAVRPAYRKSGPQLFFRTADKAPKSHLATRMAAKGVER